MPRLRCHYVDCVFLDQGYCGAAAAEIDPEEGCLTYSATGEVAVEDAWEENEALEEEWADAVFTPESEEDEDFWLEDDPLGDEEDEYEDDEIDEFDLDGD